MIDKLQELHDRGISVRSYRAAAATPDSVDEDTRSVSAVIATEDPVMVFSFTRGEAVDEVLLMKGLRGLPAQIPLLDSHDRSSVTKQLGSTRGLRVENGQLVGRNHFADDPDAQSAFRKVKDGHVRDNSIGYSVRAAEMIEPKETRAVMGSNFTARGVPMSVVTEWTVRENSILPIGADPRAKMRASKESKMATEKKEAPKVEAPVVAPAPIELDAERAAREGKANRDWVRSFCPDSLWSFAERALLEGKTPDQIRHILLEEHARQLAPVGTPDVDVVAPVAPDAEDSKRTTTLDSETLLRGLAG